MASVQQPSHEGNAGCRAKPRRRGLAELLDSRADFTRRLNSADGSWTGEVNDEYDTASALIVLLSRDRQLWNYR